jgi:glycosyltransferase involved in cell wall biosynthesis
VSSSTTDGSSEQAQAEADVRPPLFSVVIPVRNMERLLRLQLESLVGQVDPPPFEVIVVDNGSTDATTAVAGEFAGRLVLQVLSATERASAPYARNVGARTARGDFALFIDADDVSDPNLLSAYAARSAECRLMGGRCDEQALNEAVNEWRSPLTVGELPVAYETFRYFMMGNCAIHRSVFTSIGWFDESLVRGGEEIEFSIRAQLAGYSIDWVPDAVIYYRHQTTARGIVRQFFTYGRGDVVVFDRYHETAHLPPKRGRHTWRSVWSLVSHPQALLRRNSRGEWLRRASFVAGQARESLHRRIWHVG